MNRRLKKAQFRDLYLYVQKQIKNEMKPPLSSKLFSFAIVIVEVDVFFSGRVSIYSSEVFNIFTLFSLTTFT